MYTVVDLEATGLDREKALIVQASAIRCRDNGEVISSHTLYFYNDLYEKNWSAEAEAIHHISL